MTELPYLGLRPSMFQGAVNCPCGFATSNEDLYNCPNCGKQWKAKPVDKAVVDTGPKVGTKLTLTCVICQAGLEAGELVFAGGSDLAHESCIKQPAAEIPGQDHLSDYLKIAQGTSQGPKKKRRRKRKRPNGTGRSVHTSQEPVDGSVHPDPT